MEEARLVLLLRETIMPAEPVCGMCLYADQQGRPRHRGQRLLCASELPFAQAGRYRCQMGFHLARVDTAPSIDENRR